MSLKYPKTVASILEGESIQFTYGPLRSFTLSYACDESLKQYGFSLTLTEDFSDSTVTPNFKFDDDGHDTLAIAIDSAIVRVLNHIDQRYDGIMKENTLS